MPKIAGGFQEFEADLNFAGCGRAEARHAAQLLLLRGAIRDQQLLAHSNLTGQQNQRSVHVHDKRVGFLDERSFLRTLHRANRYRQRDDYPLAAAARTLDSAFHWVPWGHDELCYGSRGLRTMVRAGRGFNQ
jgi:hypothetical protein